MAWTLGFIPNRKKGMRDGTSIIGRQFQTERLIEPAYVEVWKDNGKIRSFIFCVGEFLLHILRLRPYQRIHDRVVRNNIRPWLMGRVTFKKKILLENPGRPGITLSGLYKDYKPGGHDDDDSLLSTAVWINGERLKLRELTKSKDSAYGKHGKCKIVITTTPILEQTFQIGNLRIIMEIILSSSGPLQRMTVENLQKSPLELNYSFMNLLPNKITEYYGHDNQDEPFSGNLGYPSEGSNTTGVAVPQAQWLVLYNPDNQFGTLIHSPNFKKEKREHLLVVDHRQNCKVYHIVGDCENLPRVPDRLKLTGMTVHFGYPQQLTLFTRPIEATWEYPTDREIGIHRTPVYIWKERAIEEMNRLRDYLKVKR